MPLDLNLLRSRPLALLVFAAAAVGQPWPADVTGCREGFYLASPAAAEGCTACPEVPQAIAVTCTGPDDSIATACQDTYHLKDDGSCAFDEAQEIAARILLGSSSPLSSAECASARATSGGASTTGPGSSRRACWRR
jgi:hypothetical protein